MPKKIMIVDDEIHVQVLLKQVLEDFGDAGVELLVAGDGQQAWDTVQAKRPDLIILDIMLPGFSGYELCQRIRGDPSLSSMYVIMLTARGQVADQRRGIEVGANEYITKPFDPKHLIDRIANALAIPV